jgi:hypothetical protein
MSAMCCPLSRPDGRADLYESAIRTARKAHVCEECGKAIAPGERYENVEMLYDGDWSSNHTCLMCVEIRDHFSCGEGSCIGLLWSDLEENFFPDMKAGGPCMEGLSPAAKAELCARRLEWVLEHDEYLPCDRALPPAWEAARQDALAKEREAEQAAARAESKARWEYQRITGRTTAEERREREKSSRERYEDRMAEKMANSEQVFADQKDDSTHE